MTRACDLSRSSFRLTCVLLKLFVFQCEIIECRKFKHTKMKVDGKAALVTGGAQGLGKGFSKILLQNGAKVSYSL